MLKSHFLFLLFFHSRTELQCVSGLDDFKLLSRSYLRADECIDVHKSIYVILMQIKLKIFVMKCYRKILCYMDFSRF